MSGKPPEKTECCTLEKTRKEIEKKGKKRTLGVDCNQRGEYSA
jgi:hypothetical protein